MLPQSQRKPADEGVQMREQIAHKPPVSVREPFGRVSGSDEVQSFRNKNRLSQKEMARKAIVSAGLTSEIENGIAANPEKWEPVLLNALEIDGLELIIEVAKECLKQRKKSA